MRGSRVDRYYDPQTGQFLTVDPLVDATEQSYAYANGDPPNLTDPNGLMPGFGSEFGAVGARDCLDTSSPSWRSLLSEPGDEWGFGSIGDPGGNGFGAWDRPSPAGILQRDEAIAAEAGPGVWTAVNESMSARVAAYQEQVTGRAASESYVVNGVKFDGYADGVLQEAKGPGYGNFVKNGEFRDWFRGQNSLAAQAERQLVAADGTPITWSVAERAAVEAIENLFADRGITGINVVYVPPRG